MEIEKQFYYAVNGELTDEESYLIAGIEIKNEFTDGEPCDILYDEAYAAKEVVCRKLSVEEDKDLELIFDHWSAIMKIVAERMFEYGVMYGKTGE